MDRSVNFPYFSKSLTKLKGQKFWLTCTKKSKNQPLPKPRKKKETETVNQLKSKL